MACPSLNRIALLSGFFGWGAECAYGLEVLALQVEHHNHVQGVDVAARDFLAGMTDRYAMRLFEELFIPRPWGPVGS